MSSPIEAAQDKVKELSDRDADTTDSEIRYLAYGARLRTALRASTRYIAYVGDPIFVLLISCKHVSRQATSERPFDQLYLHGL